MGYYGSLRGDFYRRPRGDFATAIQKWMPGAGVNLDIMKKVLGSPTVSGGIGAGLETAAQYLRGKGKYRIQPDGGSVRSYRRMNPLNPRALRRALRRAKGFEHFARKVMHLTHRRPGTTRFRFPRRRKR